MTEMTEERRWSPLNEINPETRGIGSWTTRKIIEYRLEELMRVFEALTKAAPQLEAAVAVIVERVKSGGRVVTIGAGGSGVAGMSVIRELPQNHREMDPRQFTYVVAGGTKIFESLGCEELEDSWEEGRVDINLLKIGEKDVVIAISATGRTPYTRGAATRARELGAYTIGIVCQPSELEAEVDLPILLDAGPEMFMGATCEKAATAQTVALEAVMDAAVVRLGFTDDNCCRARLCHDKARRREEFLQTTSRQHLAAPRTP